MKILVIGDTHGQLNKIREIFPKLTNLDLIAHTGDRLEDGRALEREFGIPVVAVKGNCDGSYSADDFEIIETDYGRILLTHGHMQHVNYRLDNLYYKAMEENCKAVFFGHTHKALVTEEDGIYLVNPGSLSQPRDDSDGILCYRPHLTGQFRGVHRLSLPPLWAAAIKTGRGQVISAASSTSQRQILACISTLHTIKSEKKEAFVYESTIFITLHHLYRRYDHFSMRNQPQHQDRSGRFTADLHALRHITDLAPQLSPFWRS